MTSRHFHPNQVYGRRHEENCRLCPITAELTDHPSVLSVIFSVLPAGKSLPSHKVRCLPCPSTTGYSASMVRGRCTAMKKVANRNVRDFGWEIRSRRRFTTPADSPLHDGSAYSHVHARRESLSVVHHSRSLLCRPVPNLDLTIHNFCIAVVFALAAQGPCKGVLRYHLPLIVPNGETCPGIRDGRIDVSSFFPIPVAHRRWGQ